ncbi:calsyntenin-1 isoform X1 [Lingula anatina]|uniref:Calsyntenin-1 isoform X1 n=1 Tax=Lingula anatina TaxID=7574 RepID=A0A1S3HFF0_LINAN|nr:calsyntenin-1 isoform X1 [Lingula anatina]|eukprot:XP_013384807.1 calsyntenin-1 isoform X1 [Lingula anatina]
MLEVRWSWLVAGALIIACLNPGSADDAHAPVLVDERGQQVTRYHGWIPESGTVVDLEPKLFATDADDSKEGLICGYDIIHNKTPFYIELLNRETGEARIKLKQGEKLDYEDKKRYRFQIRAYDCGKLKIISKTAEVVVLVEDVDEFAPEWDALQYSEEVQEGIMYEKVLQVKATDKDASEVYKNVCGYLIVTPDVPFDINRDGVIFNTAKLNASIVSNYMLKVKAVDCGEKMSESVLVNIKVKPTCKVGWTGISDRIEYMPNSGRKMLFEKAEFSTCDIPCKEERLSVKVKLQTDHIGKGCDRDTYSVKSQRKLCGANTNAVDLLPPASMGESWTKNLPTDDGNEGDQINAFDGATNAAEVPSGKFNHTLSEHFTIMTWMKHQRNPLESGIKEHILCNSDGEIDYTSPSEDMNRHHYALYLHNCKLVLLLRKEAGNDLNKFSPAEWRWNLPEVCDGNWHHYAISIDFPQVRLYVDGNMFVATHENSEVIEDWPLHPTHIHFTRLVIGACYQAGKHKLGQFFKGYLAHLSILRGETEKDNVIKCMNNCQEKLEFHAMDQVNTGMSISFNSEMSEITVTGHDSEEVDTVVRQIGYVNARAFPTVGRRNLEITSSVSCSSYKKINIPSVQTYIMVVETESPTITISGTGHLIRPMTDLAEGVAIFQGLSIVSKAEDGEDENEVHEHPKLMEQDTKPTGAMVNLDMCTITANPPLDVSTESLTLPANQIQHLQLEHKMDANSVVISGADLISNYQAILHGVKYANSGSSMRPRAFVVQCSEMNGRFVSNKFKVQIEGSHKQQAVVHENQAHAMSDKVYAHHNSIQDSKGRDMNLEERTNTVASVSGHANAGIVVIIVICVGFLMFMIVLGVIRIRAQHNQHNVVKVEENPEMEWDNSALSITVNPMESEGLDFEDDHVMVHGNQGEDSDSDDDISSYHDELESSEDESEKVKDRELEWDDSTLTF